MLTVEELTAILNGIIAAAQRDLIVMPTDIDKLAEELAEYASNEMQIDVDTIKDWLS